MATRVVFAAFILVIFSPKTWSQMLLDDVFGEVETCEDVCEKTFPLHTYEKAVHLGYCRRGCRLFTIIDFVDEYSNLNQTRHACADSCGEAYSDDDNKAACVLGCDSQLPIAQKQQEQEAQQEQQFERFPLAQFGGGMVSPLMYVHSWYSNMVDKFSDQMSVSWSFYMQSDNGQMVVVRSEPKILVNTDGNWQEPEYKTSNYIETNLADVDNSATPNLANSQLHSMRREMGLDAQPATEHGSDWLSCFAKKMGVPKMLLTGTIFVSAFVMIWIILSATVTAPDQKVMKQPQVKLSINGDLEYLRELGDKSLLAAYSPQEASLNAPPLPVKIKVQRI